VTAVHVDLAQWQLYRPTVRVVNAVKAVNVNPLALHKADGILDVSEKSCSVYPTAWKLQPSLHIDVSYW